MADKSRIEWTDTTWNPITGCTRVSEGCRYCYAERQSARLAGMHPEKYEGVAEFTDAGPRWTGTVRFHPEVLDQPLRWQKPRRIFVCSMSDLFQEAVTDEQVAAVFGVMAACPQHTFQVLTKRPERARAWFDGLEVRATLAATIFPADDLGWRRGHVLSAAAVRQGVRSESHPQDGKGVGPCNADRWPLPNVWLGTSVEDQATADERIQHLLACPAAVRWVSYEPALGPVRFGAFLRGSSDPPNAEAVYGILSSGGQWLDWIIVGGESGPGARPFEVEWARSTIRQCREAGVACFVKQDSGPKPGRQGSLPDDVWAVKEFPDAT